MNKRASGYGIPLSAIPQDFARGIVSFAFSDVISFMHSIALTAITRHFVVSHCAKGSQ